MKTNILLGISIGLLTLLVSCCGNLKKEKNFLAENTEHAAVQYGLMLKNLKENDNLLSPRTVSSDGEVVYGHRGWDWTLGFFPGSLWYLYDLTDDNCWKSLAEKYTESLKKEQYNTSHHDIGFIIGCSYLNGMRMTRKSGYDSVVVQAAKSLCTRFRPHAGVIQSWNANKGRPLKRGWKCPVIIDNMMNLELLFEATCISGDSTYYKIAVSHANTTLKNHFHENGSSYHVVDYDPETGEVLKRGTAQGYSDESAWARGQAWAVYGYTMCYRYTHQPEYLRQAEKIYEFIFTHPNLPEDWVPYWDFDALNIPNELRDASAAAILASALYELSVYSQKGKEYKEMADKILKSLSSPVYRAEIGKNHCFLLMHSVGSYPDNAEIDVPLNYADYYFLEALKRKKDLNNQ